MRKSSRVFFTAWVLSLMAASQAHAEATTYFTLPADFSGSVVLTVTTAFTAIIVALAAMFAIRKTTKTVNKT